MMHTLKQMLAEADSALDLLDEQQAEDFEAAQKLIDDLPEFMEAVRCQLRGMYEATERLEQDFLNRLNHLQSRMADRRAQMRDAGALAHETRPSTPLQSAAAWTGTSVKEAA